MYTDPKMTPNPARMVQRALTGYACKRTKNSPMKLKLVSVGPQQFSQAIALTATTSNSGRYIESCSIDPTGQ